MQPESPVIPSYETKSEVVFAKDQPQYVPLPSLIRSDGIILTRWEPNDAELVDLVDGGDLVVWQYTGEDHQDTSVDILRADDARRKFESEIEIPESEFVRTESNLGYFRFAFTPQQIEALANDAHIFIWIWVERRLHPLRPEVVRKTAEMPPALEIQDLNLITEVPQ